MSDSTINLSPASQQDLADINKVIEAAIMQWNLPERVKRLSLPSYFYNEHDLDHLEIITAKQDNSIIAVASWEQAELKDTPGNKTGLLLHGLYVHPDYQKQGIGKNLFKAVEKTVHDKEFNGLLVKAQKDSVNFFIKVGMQELQVNDPGKDYANRLWKDI